MASFRPTASPGLGDTSNAVLTPYPRTPARTDGRFRTPTNNGPGRGRGRDDASNKPAVQLPSNPEIQLVSEDVVPDIIQFNLVFENIGGQEILNIARHDIINGQKIIYQPIQNIARVAAEFSPDKLIQLGPSLKEYFNNFKLEFEDYIPTEGNGPNGEYVYLDSEGNVIIEVVNILDEEVEVQLIAAGTTLAETDYLITGAES